MASSSSEVEIGQAAESAIRYTRAMRIAFMDLMPRVDPSAWLAPGAMVVGDVDVGPQASVWYGAVVRGDLEPIRIGARTNVQDNVTVHVTAGRYRVDIGAEVTVGHGAIVHGCRVGDACLIGMGAILLDGVEIGERCLVAAGSLVAPGVRIPPGSLVLGRPAKVIRPLRADEIDEIDSAAARYVELAERHRASVTGTASPRHADSERER